MEPVKNATHLFELPERRYHSSESWWSSFFAMVLLDRTQNDPHWCLRTYSCKDGWPLERHDCFMPGRLAPAEVIIEAPLSEHPFRLARWPTEFLCLKPDVCILRGALSQVTFIEVKTIGASLAKNHSRYLRARTHLEEQGWCAKFYYLLSHGHECPGDWSLVERDNVPIILWEDVLREAAATPFAKLVADSLTEYSTRPAGPPNPPLQPAGCAGG